MNQTIIHLDKQYICNTPKTYLELLEIIKDKTNTDHNTVNIIYQGKNLTNDNFHLNNKHNYIVLSPKLQGGGYPNIYQSIPVLFLICSGLSITMLLLAISIVSYIKYYTNPSLLNKLSHIYNLFPFLPLWDEKSKRKELLIGSVIFYSICYILSYSLLFFKSSDCGEIPKTVYLFLVPTIIPFLLFFIILYITNKHGNFMYNIFSIIFIFFGFFSIVHFGIEMRNIKRELPYSFIIAPFSGILLYVLSRFILFKYYQNSSNEMFSMVKNTLLFITIILTTSVFTTSIYSYEYMKYSSRLSSCF